MNRNSYEQRKSKFPECKPKRQSEEEQKDLFEQNLIFLLRLRQKNEALNHAVANMKKKVYNTESILSVTRQENNKHKKNIEKFMLLHVLSQRPYLQNVHSTEYMSLMRQIDSGIFDIQDALQMLDQQLHRDNVNRAEYQQILREFQNDEKEIYRHKIQTPREVEQDSRHQIVSQQNVPEEIIGEPFQQYGQSQQEYFN